MQRVERKGDSLVTEIQPVPYKGDLFESKGVLRYSHRPEYGFRLVVDIDQGIVDYYRSTIPWWVKYNRQMYGAHISVVRHEIPVNMEEWGKYEGEEVDFLYSNHVNEGEVYLWLNAFCTRLEDIRVGLGLPVSSMYTLPPDGFTKAFHITVSNKKGHS